MNAKTFMWAVVIGVVSNLATEYLKRAVMNK